jgi:hypothetical protein
MRLIWRILTPVLLVTASIVLAVFYPMLLLLFYAGAFILILFAHQTNFYRIVMLLKQVARRVERLRFEIRPKLHTGYMDYSATLDDQSEHRSRISCCL